MAEIIKKLASTRRLGIKNIILLLLLVIAFSVINLISKAMKGGISIAKIDSVQAACWQSTPPSGGSESGCATCSSCAGSSCTECSTY
jgi:hypothetical protein